MLTPEFWEFFSNFKSRDDQTRIAPALFGPRRTLKISIYVYDKLISINVIVAEEKRKKTYAKIKCNNSSLFIASETETMDV